MSDLETALDTLAAARSPADLVQAHGEAQRAIRRERRAAAKELGGLAGTLMAALRLRDQMRASGESVEACDRYLEGVLRASWPRTREWHYLCEACRDIGLELLWCPGNSTCARRKEHLGHDYRQPCTCAAGAKWKEKERTPDDYVSAGKTKKSGPMTRWGR